MRDRWWLLLFVAAGVAHYTLDLDSDKIMIGLGIFYVFLFMAKFETQAFEISDLKRQVAELEEETERLNQTVSRM